ncbi:MAG: aminotransferase class V-fold PLP-dependent enzyme [Gemmatimonadota bacterium]|nr:aminotransferase class V-fold PLP-dependent enzyme [Gemmatimonadota bacterium]
MTKLGCQKAAFTLPDGFHYLNCAYMSPLTRRVQEAGIAGIRRKGAPAEITADDFFDDVDEARRLFAALVHVSDAERIAIIPSASYALSTVARNTPLRPGQNVVTVRDQFPSNTHPWRRACREAGAEFRIVGPPSDGSDRTPAWNEALLEAIDADTAVVTLGQVHWVDGTPFDLMRIGERAREVEAAFVVDGTQSVGAVPFDVEALRPDAVVCAAYKWLMGPYSIGLAYFGARYDDGVPLEENWMGREGSRDFAGLVDQGDEYRPGAARFDVGESANFILVPMLIAALEQVLEWGVERISEYCRELCEPGFPGAGHLFGLRLPADVDPADVRSELHRRNVFVSVRGRAIRVSPHLYNDESDMEALADALRECGVRAELT